MPVEASTPDLRADLERLVHHRDQPRAARGEIASSWERCLRVGLRPDNFTVPYQPDYDEAARLTWAAEPVVSQLAQDIEGSGIGVVVCDEQGRVIGRTAAESAIVRLLDRINLAPGFDYGEDRVGTNAIGTAVANASPSVVTGTEHFAEALTGMACSASPITGPDGNVVGVIDLTCESDHASPLMLGLVKGAARDVEQRLRADRSATERALRDEFDKAQRTTRGPLVLLSPTVTLANPAAAKLLQSADQERLWDLIAPVLTGGGLAPRELQLIDGSSLGIRYEPVGDGDRVVGALVWLRSASPSGLSLTAEEREVAELVADGLTNSAVAQRLAISNYTVDSTLRRVFTKLGMRSRVQLARMLAHELHDSVSQALFSISLHARAVELAVQREGADPDRRVARGISELRTLTQGALAESVRLSSSSTEEPGTRDVP
jgi:DNA-binding CsgD family transcriptional regulator